MHPGNFPECVSRRTLRRRSGRPAERIGRPCVPAFYCNRNREEFPGGPVAGVRDRRLVSGPLPAHKTWHGTAGTALE